MAGALRRRERERRRHRGDTGKRPCDDRDGDASDAAAGRGTHGGGTRRGRLRPQGLRRERGPAGTLALDFWPPEL